MALLRIDSEQRASWLLLDRQRLTSPINHGTLSEAARQIGATPTLLITPAEATLLTESSIPVRSRQQLAQALPFALEEQLADEVEQLHFAHTQTSSTAPLSVAITSRAQMEQWRSVGLEHGLHIESMVPETLLLPIQPGSWHLLLEDHHAVLRSGPCRGLALDSHNLETVLQLALNETEGDRAVQITVSDFRSEVQPPPTVDGIEWVAAATGDSPLTRFAEGYRQGAIINLLQGNYSRREQLGAQLRPWLATAALALISLTIATATSVINYRTLSHETAANQQQIEQIYRDTFPESTRVVDALAQMEQKLKELRAGGGGAGALQLIERSGALLKQLNGTTIDRLSYREGALQLDLSATNLQLIDRFKQQLNADPELEAKIVSATTKGGEVEGRMRIGWRS